MPNAVVFAALIGIPSLFAYALPTIGRWLGGTTGMRIGAAVFGALILIPLMGAMLSFLLMASEGALFAPKHGDQILGLILSALVTVGSLAGLGTLALTWNRHLRAQQH